MKVCVCIIVYNLDCRIFLLQIKNIKKFCTDNYTIEVIDNSTNLELSEAIKYHAGNEGVSYRKTNPDKLDPSHSHAFAANLSFKMLFEYYDAFFYLDHDCIPISHFSVTQTLSDCDIAGVESGIETKYFWPGCVMWKKTIQTKDIDFSPIHKLRADTGGGFHKILKKYNCKFFSEVGHANPAFQETELYYFYMIIDNRFMHFLNSSNWNPTEGNEERLNSLINIAIEKSND